MSRLKQQIGYEGGVSLIEAKLLPAAQAWFRDRKLPIGAAIALFFSGQESDGVRRLITIGRANPNSLTVLPFLAETALIVPSLAAPALEAIEKISANNPTNSEAFYYRARLLDQTSGETAKAVDLLKQSIALDPAATPPLIELSRIYTKTGNRPAAIEALEAVLTLKPGTSIAHYRLASLYRASGQPEKASSHMAAFQKLQ